MNRPKWFDEAWDTSDPDDQPATAPPTFIFEHSNGTVWQIREPTQVRHEDGRHTILNREFYLIVRPDGNELWVRQRQHQPPMKPATEKELSLIGMAAAIQLCIKGVRGRAITEEELNEMAA